MARVLTSYGKELGFYSKWDGTFVVVSVGAPWHSSHCAVSLAAGRRGCAGQSRGKRS